MLDSSKILFLFSALSVIYLSACHIVKRKAPDGQLYVFSSREGCESVKSEAPCAFMWQLSPIIAKSYNQNNKIVNSTLERFRSRPDVFSNDCIQAFENVLCSQVFPKCSVADGARDFGDASKLCQDIYNSCPKSVVNNLKQNHYCEELKTGKHPKSPCVAPSSPVTGACPQPKYKMPSEYLDVHRKVSADLVKTFDNLRRLKYDNGERVFSSECISQLEEISCSPLYCSADETQLLTKHDQDDCNKISQNCYDKVESRLAKMPLSRSDEKTARAWKLQCDIYPIAATAQLLAEPPALKSFRTTPKSFRTTSKSFQTTPKRTSAEKRATALPNSAATCHFGHSIAFLAITASLIVKLYV